ncbi:MAG: S8 family serine peptidase, partial [Pseudomonadales bacterium]
GVRPLLVQFNASASADPDGMVATYTWDFGEPPGGSSVAGATTTHTYASTGSFTVLLRVSDDDGASATTTRTVTVSAPLASIAGTIQILSSSAIDSDVNDTGSPPTPNNDFASAQALPNPVTLGGFANRPMTGVGDDPQRGNLFSTGDPGDFYTLTMTAKDVATLNIADSATAQLALYLYDTAQTLIDADDGPGATHSVQVTAEGIYFLEVRPVTGASNYVLTVGQDLLPNRSNFPALTDAFVPGEILLKASGIAALRLDYGLNEIALSGDLALVRTSGADATLKRLGRRSPFEHRWSARKREKYATRAMIQALARDPRTRMAEPNYLRYPHTTPNDRLYASQWHYPAINLPLAWDITTGDNSVIVAVVDTGVLLTHPDLDDQMVAGFDFIDDPDRARDGDGRDSDPTDEGDLAFGGSSSFHGTHVSGTVAAETDTDATGPSPGVAGVAWNARLMPLRALGVNGGTSFDVIEAVKWAAGLSNVSNTLPAQPADVINLSLGGGSPSVNEQNVIDQVRAAGVIVVASAGNDASALPSYPAAYDGVVSVSATTIQNNAIAPYSNSGATVDIAAPGGSSITDINGDGIVDGVISTRADDSDPQNLQFGYSTLQGTSMAAPHVAGVVALMKAVHPNLTPIEFDTALAAGDLTDVLGAPGRDDQYGHGLINAHKAVLAALALAAGQGADPGPILSLSASTLVFSSALEQQTLTISNVGTGTVTVLLADIIPSEDWLTLITDAIDATGMGTYLVDVDRTGLAEGSYSATIEITSDAPNASVTVAVTMRIITSSPSADAGLHYVILVEDNGDTVAGILDVVTVDNGAYTYSINDIPPGQYRVFAGTDSDDDNFLCDDGEACGTYGTLDSPDSVTIDGVDLTDIDFTSEFRVNLNVQNTSTGVADQNAPAPEPAPRLIRKLRP